MTLFAYSMMTVTGKKLQIVDDACYFSGTYAFDYKYDNGNPNKTFRCRYFHPNGFYRGNMVKGKGGKFAPIRCFANWDLSESAPNAPRQQRITGAHNEEYYK